MSFWTSALVSDMTSFVSAPLINVQEGLEVIQHVLGDFGSLDDLALDAGVERLRTAPNFASRSLKDRRLLGLLLRAVLVLDVVFMLV